MWFWYASVTGLTYGLFVENRLVGVLTAWKSWKVEHGVGDVNGCRSGSAKTMWGAASALLRAAGVIRK